MSELFSIDNIVEEIEKEYGKIEELTEVDCEEIIYTYLNIEVKNAHYDKQLDCIVYVPEEKIDWDNEAIPRWDETYLNQLGMSMKDFV